MMVITFIRFVFNLQLRSHHLNLGVANGTLKNVGLGKFWQDLEYYLRSIFDKSRSLVFS